MLIAFEGTERAGKSTLSIKFASYLNGCRDGDLLIIDPHFGDFIWTKEPSFSSEEANQLNTPGYVDEYRRERLFFESRIRHQNYIAGKNIVCERYLWSGLAYAYKYSFNCFRLIKEFYNSESLFIQPDLYIFIDTPVETCLERDPDLDIDIQRELHEAYLKTKEYIKSPIINIKAIGEEEHTLKDLIILFDEHMK